MASYMSGAKLVGPPKVMRETVSLYARSTSLKPVQKWFCNKGNDLIYTRYNYKSRAYAGNVGSSKGGDVGSGFTAKVA